MALVLEKVPPGRSPTVRVRRMGLCDLDQVVDMHRRTFPDNVFGRLGRRFLGRYLRTFLDTTFASGEVAVVDDRVAGYLVGVLDTSRHRRLVRRHHGQALAAVGVVALVRRPHIAVPLLWRRIGVRLRRRGPDRGAVAGAARSRQAVAVLTHVAVDGDFRGDGIGSILVGRFVEACRASGADVVSLATLDGEDGAGRFYEERGWTLSARRKTFDGRSIRLYDLALDDVE